jgi:oligoendopeptidase F
MERNQIEQKDTWQTDVIFPSMQAWEQEFADVDKTYSEYDYSRFFGKLADKQTLLDCLRLSDEMSRRIEKLYGYAHMRHDEDVRVSQTTSAVARAAALASKLFACFAFVEPELTALPEERLQAFIADKDFADYDYRLRKVIQDKAHVLSSAEEKLLALGSDVMGGFRDVFMMMDNANLNLPKASYKGEEMQISHGMYGMVLRSGTVEERKEWFEKYYGAYIALIDTITQAYYGNVKKDVFYKTVRGYDSCLAMALSGEDVEPVVYDNLIKATHTALPVMHDYISFRKQVLGTEEQHMYDVYVPLVDNASLTLPFDEAYDLVVEGLAPLGKDYQELLYKGKKERWIDVYETTGKRSGAYSTGSYDAPHPYVLLNYQPTLNDVFTIAHEMGHALHTYKSNSAQPYAKAGYTIFLAEIASTVNEVLLLKHLYAKSTDDTTKKY